MDYQTTESSNTMWYIIGAVIIIAIGLWYFYAPQSMTTSTESTANDTTTAAISADLEQIPDDSAAFNQAAAASAQDVSGF